MKLLIFVSSATVLISGCASNVAFDRTKYSTIKAVTISEQIVTPTEGIHYNSQTTMLTAGLLGGGLAADVIASAVSVPDKDRIAIAMIKNDIRVEQILRNQFAQELEKAGLFTISPTGRADAEFRLSIIRYGLSAIPWKRDLRPVVGVRGQLVTSDGSVLWSMTRPTYNHTDPDVPARLFEDYINNIELLRAGYTTACQIVARDLVNNLKPQ